MYNNFGVYVAKILKNMEEERSKLYHPFVGSEHLLLSLLKYDSKSIEIFNKYKITYESFKSDLIKVVSKPQKNVDFNLYTPLLKRIIATAIDNSNNNKVTTTHLISAMLEEGEGIAVRILMGLKVNLDDLYSDFNSAKVKNKTKKLSYGKNLIDEINDEEKTIGREKEINQIIETLLRKKKNNPLLIGDAGVGKTAIVEELARLIKNHNVPKSLLNAKIISIEMSNLVSGTKYRGEFEEKLTKLIDEISTDDNTILFIDEIHTMINAGGAEGAISAGDIFKPHLARSNIKCIGATTTYEYEKYLSKDKALCRRFENIFIKEPSLDETKDIITKVKEEYEIYHNVKISKNNINDLVEYAGKYIHNKKNPDKTLDLLDTICSSINIKNDKSKIINKYLNELNIIKKEKEKAVLINNFNMACILKEKEVIFEEKIKQINKNNKVHITNKDILNVIRSKCNIPYLENKDIIINNLENNLKSIIGQNLQKLEIIKVIKNKINNIDENIFLLLKGMQGSGKTYTLKKIEESLPNINVIKINGEEYTSATSITKLIGTPAGYVGYGESSIFDKIKYNPYSLMILENYNMLDYSIKKIFESIKENGYIVDNKGDKINFSGSLIIATITEKNKEKVGFNDLIINTDDDLIHFDKIIKFDNITKEDVFNYLKAKNIEIDNIDKINYKENGLKYISKSSLILN